VEGDLSAPLHRLGQAHTPNAPGKALIIRVLRHLWKESSLHLNSDSVSSVTKDWLNGERFIASKFMYRQGRDGETRVNGYIPCHNGCRHVVFLS